MQHDPAGDAFAGLQFLAQRVAREPALDFDAQRAGVGIHERDGGARGAEARDDFVEDEVERFARILGAVHQFADAIQAFQRGGLHGEAPLRCCGP